MWYDAKDKKIAMVWFYPKKYTYLEERMQRTVSPYDLAKVFDKISLFQLASLF